MKRWLALALVGGLVGLIFLAAPGVAQGDDWLRSGYDPGRTGAIPFEGPQTNDTAFTVELPGTPVSETVLVDGEAYVLTDDGTHFDGDTEDLNQTALWRIELDTGEIEKVLDLEGLGPRLVTTELVVAEDEDELVAIERSSGEERWRAEARSGEDTEVVSAAYTAPIAADGILSTAFVAIEGVVAPQGGCVPCERVVGIMTVDLDSGETLWEVEISQERRDPRPPSEDRPEPLPPGALFIGALSIDRERVYAYGQAVETASGPTGLEDEVVEKDRRRFELWTIDTGQEAVVWNRSDTEQRETAVHTPAGRRAAEDTLVGSSCCASPVVTPRAVHTRLDSFQALNKVDGAIVWDGMAGRTDQISRQGAQGMGARGDAFVGASEQTVFRLDAGTGDLVWSKTDPTPDKKYETNPVVIDADTVYVSTDRNQCGFQVPGIEARDLETGDFLWEWSYEPSVGRDSCSGTTPNDPAFGPGVMVWGTKDGTVHVVGKTEASLGGPDVPQAKYPGVGNETTIDASGAEPGVHGEATRYMVDWGDGTISGWQTDPVFSHAYNESGTYEAQVYAGNEANQTSSTFVTMNVGEDPPAEPNWLSERFEPENQDMTFGVLGLAVALGGGAIGVARRKRKKSVLQQELDALERGFEETREQPTECEALLDNRKARARSLALDGKLDEEQVTVVENRAEELRSTLRRDALEQEFGFLPHSLVAKARQMVEDGQVTSLEKDAFLQAVEEDEMLTSQQRTQVRERIEAWFARDAGGGPG